MLHVFSTNRVKLVARTPKATNNKGQRGISLPSGFLNFQVATLSRSEQQCNASS